MNNELLSTPEKMEKTKEKKFKSYKASKIASNVLAHVILVFLSIIWIYPIFRSFLSKPPRLYPTAPFRPRKERNNIYRT